MAFLDVTTAKGESLLSIHLANLFETFDVDQLPAIFRFPGNERKALFELTIFRTFLHSKNHTI